MDMVDILAYASYSELVMPEKPTIAHTANIAITLLGSHFFVGMKYNPANTTPDL